MTTTVFERLVDDGQWEKVIDVMREHYGYTEDMVGELLMSWRVMPTKAQSYFGLVNYGTKIMRLTVLPCAPEQLIATLLHETAHIIAGKWMDDHRHGFEWKKLARAFGIPAKSCSADKEFQAATAALRASKQRTVARCTKCGFEHKQQNRSRRDWSLYTHRRCGGQFVGVNADGTEQKRRRPFKPQVCEMNPVLNDNTVYFGDNWEVACGEHIGMQARHSGHTISGTKVVDVAEFCREQGDDGVFTCERKGCERSASRYSG